MEKKASEFAIENIINTDKKTTFNWILSHAKFNWRVIVIGILGAFANAVFNGITPLIIGRAFNSIVTSSPDLAILFQCAFIIAILQILCGLMQIARNFGFELAAQRIEKDIRNELYVSLLGKSMTFHSIRPVGDTMARATNDVREINYMFSPGLNLVIGSLNFLIMPFVIAPTYHPSLVLTPIVFLVLYIFSVVNYLSSLRPISEEIRTSFGQLNSRLSESLEGIETVKGTANEKMEISLFGLNVEKYRKAMIKQGDLEARYIPLLLFFISLAFGLYHALLLFQFGILNLGQVIGYYGLLLMLEFPTFASLFAYANIAMGLAGARRILELINFETRLDQNPNGYSGPMTGKIEFHNVSLNYGDEIPALHNISFTASSGQTIAIVGQTGSGKTSLVKLINRIYDVSEGKVMIDGKDVREWNLDALRKNISIIEQDVFLFSRTIAENISFGKPDASQNDIETVAKAAQAHDFIQSFSDGYNTIIGERGVTLSGGQRQRIALARAFLTNPRILILDDATSSIDSETEDKIQRAIFTATSGRTSLIITHRLSQIRWADLILVLRHGKLEVAGNHEQLIQSSESYRMLFSDSLQ